MVDGTRVGVINGDGVSDLGDFFWKTGGSDSRLRV